MNRIVTFSFAAIAILLSIASCNNGPKVIPTPDDANTNGSTTGVFSEEEPASGQISQLSPSGTIGVHTVVVQEVLPTEKYVYLRVKEAEEEFWIATGKQEVNAGETYFYREGLLKTNFISKEYNRTFDKLYLVSNIVKADHGSTMSSGENPSSAPQTNVEAKNSVKIKDLVADPKKYAGKTIQVSGKCTKVNPNIMGRNWIHLNDGSTDYDLVITSAAAVSVGQTVTITGTVVLNKDFGAGYFYDILIEDGQIVQ